MPIEGIRTGDPFKFEFRWKTFRVLQTIIFCALGLFMTTTYLVRIAGIGITTDNIGKNVMYNYCCQKVQQIYAAKI